MNRILIATLIGITTACGNGSDNDARIATQLRGIAEVQANQQQVLAALARQATAPAPAATAVTGTAATTTTAPVTCPPGMVCNTVDVTGKVVGVVVGPPATPCATGNCNAVAPVVIPPAETCGIDGCLFKTIASYIGAGWVIALEVGLGAAGLALFIGAAFYVLRRLRERRHDHAWHETTAYLKGRYREAHAVYDAVTDTEEQLRWRRRMERRHAALMGHMERESVPATDLSDLPPPPPIVDARARDRD